MSRTRHRTLTFGVVLLAAGASSRMGCPKLLLPWAGTTVLDYLLRVWNQLGSMQIATVLAQKESPLAGELDRLGCEATHRIYNPAPERGMFSSIQCAACWPGWNPKLTHWIIALGDQPHLRITTLSGLLDFAANHSDHICQPGWRKRPKHPVLLPRAAFYDLAHSRAETLKSFLAARSAACLCFEVDDPGLESDLDYPSDYETWQRLRNRPESRQGS